MTEVRGQITEDRSQRTAIIATGFLLLAGSRESVASLRRAPYGPPST
jgi:hypothetical protein